MDECPLCFSFLADLPTSTEVCPVCGQVLKTSVPDSLNPKPDSSLPKIIEDDWRDETALVYPVESASPADLRELGNQLEVWAKTQKSVQKIRGLQQLLDGLFPPPWIGGPINPAELNSNSLCAAVILTQAEANDTAVIKSLRQYLPSHLVRAVCYAMPWN